LKWSEESIGRVLAWQVFDRKHLLILPNCQWAGDEADILVVTPNLRVIDVEIKISRADLKADARKEKWFERWDYRIDGPYRQDLSGRRPRQWPSNVWKHYYCLPLDIWKPELFECISPMSGVLTLQSASDGSPIVRCQRKATPNRKADRIDPEDAIDIARLASFRMWDAFKRLDEMRATEAVDVAQEKP